MEYNKKTDQWIGTPKEHLQKLLETHTCICSKARKLIQTIINEVDLIEQERKE